MWIASDSYVSEAVCLDKHTPCVAFTSHSHHHGTSQLKALSKMCYIFQTSSRGFAVMSDESVVVKMLVGCFSQSHTLQ